MRLLSLIGACVAITGSVSVAAAHFDVTVNGITVEEGAAEAPIGRLTTIAFGIGHGCRGTPTIDVRMLIPTGVLLVQPYVKQGWEIETSVGAYEAPQQRGRVEIRDGVLEVHWSGGSVPDRLYDQFLIRAQIADNVEPGTVLWFKIVQECVDGAYHWVTPVEEGQLYPREPAVGLRAVSLDSSAGPRQ